MEKYKNDKEIFEVVSKHLLTQNKRAMITLRGYTNCAYRANDGTKCAIGCLIPDEKYSLDLENHNVWDDRVVQVLVECGVDNLAMYSSTWKLLKQLQWLHDNVRPVEWSEQLAKFNFDAAGFYTPHAIL